MPSIPCTYMRSGTSKGPFFDLRDLPSTHKERDRVLLRIMGSPDANQIDGLGGATFVTSKVVMVQPSERPNVDVDYLFAQVSIDSPIVDTRPTCGNMMAGVGPFAIEKGWVKATQPQTSVRVYNINTDSYIEIIVQTPNSIVNYTEGECMIDGVPGTAAAVVMNVSDVGGGTTGTLFPTGRRKDTIEGVDVSVVDSGNLMLLFKASSLGLTGRETSSFFDENTKLMSRIEQVRLRVGREIGLGDVSDSVLPKVGILSKPQAHGHIKSQYFTPHTLHPTHAVSGAICVATAMLASGTVASEVGRTARSDMAHQTIIVEHPSGVIPVEMTVDIASENFKVVKAGSLRTVRKIMDGVVYY